MNKEQLKIPSGKFSHSDLAAANGKSNQQVWVEYSRLRKEGIIVPAGSRSAGKGKPTLLWKLADGQPVPVAVVPPVKSPTVGLKTVLTDAEDSIYAC